MRKDNLIKTAMGLFLLILTIQNALAYVEIDKEEYVLGEMVSIRLDIESLSQNFDNYNMKIESSNDIIKYSGKLKETVAFNPKRAGHYAIIIETRNNIIEEKGFLVKEMIQEGTEGQILNETQEDKGRKYELGEEVEIEYNDTQEIKVEVKGKRDFFSYIGSISKKIFFKPSEEGKYEVVFKDMYNNILKKLSFNVEDSSKGNSEGNQNLNITQKSKRIADLSNAIEEKYDKAESNRTVKIRNSKDQIMFEEAKLTDDNEIVITDHSKKLKKAIFRNVRSETYNLGFEEHKESKEYSKEIKKTVVSSYAIDPSSMEFDNASLIFTAKGTELYKCGDWNFQEQSCIGTWQKIQDIEPGQEYELIIDPLDPGYAETGVASINTNKSIYYPLEKSKIMVAFLNTNGFLTDPENITLTITDPSDNLLVVDQSSIIRTSKGIYEYVYENTNQAGSYQIQAQAQGAEIDILMITSFEVRNNIEFDIIREAPITTDPWSETINSTIRIIPNINPDNDLMTVVEDIPSNFTVIDSGGATVTLNGTKKTLTWNNMLAMTEVSYEVQAPLRTPDLYALGPAIIRYVINSSSEMFIEARQWYIAIDPVSDITTSTCNIMDDENADNSYVDGACSSNSNLDADDTSYETQSIGNAVKWQGIEVTASSISGCYQVNSVQACYSWWSGASSKANCQVDVSNDGAGGASYTNIDTTCRNSDPGLICSDVTSTLTWTCASFTSDNAAMRIHFQGRRNLVSYDAAFFRVNYTSYSNPPVVQTYAKNESTVYENMYIRFNSTWTDDQALDSYIFSIDQGSGWINSSPTSFSGSLAENISYITASVGTTVYWKFYANDSQGQWTEMTAQSFVVAPASDFVYPTVNTLTVTPSIGLSGTVFNITADITDNVAVSSANAEITFPDGTRTNYSMSTVAGNNWEYLYTSNVGGNFSVRVYGSDGNGNTNVSQTTEYFNVSSTISVDGLYYARGETVQISGAGFSDTEDVQITIMKKGDGTIVSGFPLNQTSTSTGALNYSWIIPSDLSFKPGNYTIVLNDTFHPDLDAGTEVIIVIRPDSATITDRLNSGTDVKNQVNESDNIDQTIVLSANRFAKEDYIEIDFDNNIPTGQQVDEVTFGFEHYEDFSYTFYLTWYNTSSSSWVTACTYSSSTQNRISTCNLTSIINTNSLANDIKLRITDSNLHSSNAGDSLTNINFTFLDIQYSTSSTTTVIINEPSYVVNGYDYTDSTNNKAWYGTTTGLPASITTGTEISSTNYTYTTASDDNKFTHYVYSNSLTAYQSFQFKVLEDINSISSLELDYEGYTANGPTPKEFWIYVWNFTSSSYQEVYSTGSPGFNIDQDIEVSLSGASDYINSSSGDIWFYILAEVTTGSDRDRYIHTDLITLDVLEYPTISGMQYINVSAYDSDGIASCNYSFRSTSVYGNLTLAGGEFWNGSTNTQLLTDGFYWFDSYCVDDLNSPSGSDSVYLQIQNSPPTVYLMNPQDNHNYSTSTFDVQFNTTSQSGGIISCNITLNGEVNNTSPILANSGQVTNYTLTGIADDDYYWNITCWKDEAVTNTSETRFFTVDTTPPTISKDYPTTDQYIGTGSFDFLFTPYDFHDIENCTLYLDGSINQTKDSSQLTNGIQNGFTVSGLAEGNHSWDIMCYDTFGNNQTTSTTYFTVDLTSPSVNLYDPLPDQIFGYNNINFNWSAVDALDSDPYCNLTLDGSNIVSDIASPNSTFVNETYLVTNGIHFWNVTCFDAAGNINTSETRNFTVAAPPLPILISPPDQTGGFTTTTGTFVYNATHTAPIDNCSLYIDGAFRQSDNSIGLNEYNNFTVPGLTSGSHTWQVRCENGAGIGNSSIWTYWVDLVDPTVTLDSPRNETEINGTNITLAWFAVDDLTSNLTCDLSFGGTVHSGLDSLNNTNTTHNLTGLTDGTYYWNVTCYDRLNRTDISETWWVKINGAPTITLDSPDNNANLSTENITFLFTPSDSGGLQNCSIYIDGELNQTKTSAELTNDAQNNFTVYNIAEGIHNWTIGCVDTVNDSTILPVRNFTLDLTAPNISLITPNGSTYYTDTVYFNWSVTDNYANEMSCTIDISNHGQEGPYAVTDGSLNSQLISGLSDGFHEYNISCLDDAGNIGLSENYNFTIDTFPVITLISPIGYSGTNETTVIFEYTATDTSGVDNCSLYLNEIYQYTNSSINTTGSNYFTLSGLSQGLYNWSVQCYDTNSIQGNSSTEHFYVDQNGPRNITLNYPKNNSIVHASTIDFNITAVDDIAQTLSCDLSIDGSYNSTFSAINNTPSTISIPDFSEGNHSWQVTCFDSSFYFIVSPVYYFNVSFDPLVTLINPQPYSWHNTTDVEIFYLPEDNNATLDWCDLYVDGSFNYTERPSSGTVSSYTIPDLSQGFHTWYWECNDWDGNRVNSSLWNFTVDLVAPTINLDIPLDGDAFNTSQVTFNLTASDNMAENLTCSINLDGTVISSEVIGNSTNLTFTQSGIDDGIHYWNATCVDLAQNSNTSETRNFTVQEPPRVELVNPSDDTRTNNQTINFFFIPYDNSNNLSNCTIIINGERNITNDNITEGILNNISVGGFADGEYNWTVNCTDPSGNEGTNATANRLIIDLTPPSINLTYPQNEDILASETVNFNWTSTDFWGTNLFCNLSIDGTVNASGLPATSGIWTNHTVTLPYGPHNWSVTCWDDLFNYNSSETLNFTVQAPDLYINNAMIWFNNSNPDLGENITIRANISNIGSSTASDFKVRFFDGDPLSGGIQIGSNITATLAPYSNITINQSWVITQGLHNIWVTVNEDEYVFELNFSNNNATRNISVLSAVINSPENGTWTNDLTPEFNFTLKDYTGGIIDYSVLVDGSPNGQSGSVNDNQSYLINISSLTEAQHYIIIRATDQLGRIKDSQRIYINIDNTSAVADFNTQNNSWFNISDPTISFNLTDNLDTVINYTFYINQTMINTSSSPVDTEILQKIGPLGEGKYNITVGTLDEAGNKKNYTISIYIDLTEPTTVLESPVDNANFTTSSIVLNISSTDNLAQNLNCSIILDGAEVQNGLISNGGWLSYTANLFTEETHFWNATCIDEAGNKNISQTRSFDVFIPPIIELVNPQDDVWSNTQTNIFYFNVTDDTGIENCSLIINGTVNSTKPGSQIDVGGISNISGTLDEGIWNWAIQCYDNTTQNVVNISQNRSIKVDLTPPNPQLTTANESWFNTPGIDIYFNLTDNMASTINYTLYEDGIIDSNGSYPNPSYYVNSSATISGFANIILIEATDEAGNKQNSTPITVYYDFRLPTVVLNQPENNSVKDNNTIVFNFSMNDDRSPTLSCNLTVDGSVLRNYSSLATPETVIETIGGFTAGEHYWNVTCSDLAGNLRTSLTYSFIIPRADFMINSGNISFSDPNPVENANITIYANVYNINASAGNNIIVQFYNGNPETTGVQIGTDQNIPYIAEYSNYTVSINWTTVLGTSDIYVLVDPPIATNGSINETDETNNIDYRSITISGNQVIAGNISSSLSMNKGLYNTLFSWNKTNRSGDNIFVADYESTISWTELQAIGRDRSGLDEFDDFAEIDAALLMTNFTDSINRTYTSGGSPVQTRTVNVFSNNIINVPTINSTNNTNFFTGILWDSGDGTNYNGTQDLIFMTEVNMGKPGYGGIYDFEIKIPARLREYKTTNTKTVAFYAEVK